MNAFARFMSMAMDDKDPGGAGLNGEVAFTDFVKKLEKEVQEFKGYWAEKHVENPEMFPRDLPSEAAWFEQFIVWSGLQ